MEDQSLTENQREIKLLELSDELGFSKKTIHWVYACITTLNSRKADDHPEGRDQAKADDLHITGFDVCRALIRDLNEISQKPIRETLSDIKILSSEDIGKIVFGLVGKNLIKASPDDSIDDFAGVFNLSNLDEFLEKEGIKKKKIRVQSVYRKLMWTLYIVGLILIIGSYTKLVSAKIGWFGWCIGMTGFCMQFLNFPKPKRF